MFLLGLAVQWEFIVTGPVLIGAVAIDSLWRQRPASVGRVRAMVHAGSEEVRDHPWVLKRILRTSVTTPFTG